MTARAIAPALLVVLTGCGLPANVVVLLPDESGTVGQVAVHGGGTTAELTKPLTAVNAGSGASLHNVFTAQRSDVDSEFAGALAAAPRAPLIHTLYFQTGLVELDPRSRGDLAAAIAAAKGTANVDISVVGHADATGTDAYNSALSLKRAQIVRDALVEAGVPSEVIEIAYHGANNPLVPTPRGVPELRNRRVEVTIR
jgi:outer membrane protein OmpA-like peptidoglycan-associated protein